MEKEGKKKMGKEKMCKKSVVGVTTRDHCLLNITGQL